MFILNTPRAPFEHCTSIMNQYEVEFFPKIEFLMISCRIMQKAEIHTKSQICVHCSEMESLEAESHTTTIPHTVLNSEQHKVACHARYEIVC